jgi:Alpha galactosidase C-terminal beta sandwich domain
LGTSRNVLGRASGCGFPTQFGVWAMLSALRDDGTVIVRHRALADGGAALVVVNVGDQSAHVANLPAGTARDLWSGHDIDARSVDLAPHATALLRLPPGS